MRSKKYHLSLLHISNLSPLSNSAHITQVCEQSLFAFILRERWNDLSTNATYYKQFLTKKRHKLNQSILQKCTTKHHKNRLHLSSLSPYPASQLDVFGHDGDSLSVDGTQISIFKQTHQVRFACLLWRTRATLLDSLRGGRAPALPSARPHTAPASSPAARRWRHSGTSSRS